MGSCKTHGLFVFAQKKHPILWEGDEKELFYLLTEFGEGFILI